jgi:hypothetical protein
LLSLPSIAIIIASIAFSGAEENPYAFLKIFFQAIYETTACRSAKGWMRQIFYVVVVVPTGWAA